MRIIIFLLFALMTTSDYAGESLSDEEQILELQDDWVRALETRDRQLLDQIVAREFTFIEPDGTVKNRDEYLADRSSEIAMTFGPYKNC